MRSLVIVCWGAVTLGWVCGLVLAEDPAAGSPGSGYRGVWYQNQKVASQYQFKYSGGLGTYCAKHQPFAVYCSEVNKTFFCYGGVARDYHKRFELGAGNLDSARVEGALHHLVSYFDHESETLPKPTVLLDKGTHDAHDNPVLSVDQEGYLWVFSTAHGRLRPAYVHRSVEPYSIDGFERVAPYRVVEDERVPITNYSYMQAWQVPAGRFLFFFTKYAKWQRETCFATSVDGVHWDNWTQLADIEEGHYQVSGVFENKGACAFNYHPRAFHGDSSRKGLNWRTNLYYLETTDFGETWSSVDGTLVNVPVTQTANPALIRDFEREGLLVYLKDLVFDPDGFPMILFVTARGFEPGPASGPRTWRMARWSGEAWSVHDITTSDNNYDMGSLFVESKQVLRVIAPTEAGPQAGNPGGEIAMWLSEDGGVTWRKQRQLTQGSEFNHTYVRRPVEAHPGFYGFWADGHGRQPSASRLYFCNRQGDVFQMPTEMQQSREEPIALGRP